MTAKKTTKKPKKGEKKEAKKVEKNKVGLFPILLILVGVIFAFDALGIIHNAIGKLWPLILITWGAYLIWNK